MLIVHYDFYITSQSENPCNLGKLKKIYQEEGPKIDPQSYKT